MGVVNKQYHMYVITPEKIILAFSVVRNNKGRGRNFCLQKFLTGLAGLVYLHFNIIFNHDRQSKAINGRL